MKTITSTAEVVKPRPGHPTGPGVHGNTATLIRPAGYDAATGAGTGCRGAGVPARNAPLHNLGYSMVFRLCTFEQTMGFHLGNIELARHGHDREFANVGVRGRSQRSGSSGAIYSGRIMISL
jgi:hypothetical protein